MNAKNRRGRIPSPRARIAAAAFFSLLSAACAHSPKPSAELAAGFDPDAYRDLVAQLTSEEMEGRGILTEGNRRAAELLAGRFEAAGLEPAGDDGTYLQCFDHPVAIRAETVALEVDGGDAIPEGAIAPAPFSSSGSFEGALVFAGYGIHAPEAGYDDYADLDAEGKVLLILRFEPRERDPESPLDGDRPSHHSDLRRKAFEARERGAAAVLFVAAPRPGEAPDQRVPELTRAEAESEAGLPVLHVLPEIADRWLQQAGTSLEAQVKAIDEAFASTPIPLTAVHRDAGEDGVDHFAGTARGEVKLVREGRSLCNVVGRLPGAGALADEAVVVGGHFDGLGFGQQGTFAPGEDALHPSADDNASGAAGVVKVARMLAALPERGARRQAIFIAFNAEEVGLAGAGHYVHQPVVPLERTVAMLNMDMIGRLRDDRLMVLGTDTGDTWGRWLEEAAEPVGLSLVKSGDGYGPSDQTPFYARGVPVLHFFTGAHEDYHRPTDTPEKLNYEGAARILKVVAEIARRAAEGETRVAFQQADGADPRRMGDARGHGAWLGTIPDFTTMSPGASGGVRISGVREGGPAFAAGLRGGDVIVSMDGRTVDNLHDMTFVLRDRRPGDVIEVAFLRDDERQVVAATLGSRAAAGGGPPHGHGDAAQAHGRPGAPEQTRRGPPPGVMPAADGPAMDPETLLFPGEERRLRNMRQLTVGGRNAEAYFSPDGKRLVFQATRDGAECDRIYVMDLESGAFEQVSSGEGRTTCGYFTWPDGESIVYASTHLGDSACPPVPDRSRGYVWPVYETYDLFLRRPGGEVVRLTDNPGYDAEATACFQDGRLVFTSHRDGNLDLYTLHPDRPDEVTRITHSPGYDGGAFFSPDCSRLVWRASRPTGDALTEFRRLLGQGLVRPSNVELYVANADGSQKRQVTRNGAANFAPYFLPDNRRVIFSSNLHQPGGHSFHLYLIDPDADDPESTVEQVTYNPGFDSFPMFSPDGRYVVFGSSRGGTEPREINLFIAEWVAE
jgi:Tol biopolymer transport system component